MPGDEQTKITASATGKNYCQYSLIVNLATKKKGILELIIQKCVMLIVSIFKSSLSDFPDFLKELL